jgi:hypothetical protein
MRHDNGLTLTLALVGGLTAGAELYRRRGSRSAESRALMVSLKTGTKAAAGLASTYAAAAAMGAAPVPGARVLAVVMVLGPMVVSFGSKMVEEYLAAGPGQQVEMVRRWVSRMGKTSPLSYAASRRLLKDDAAISQISAKLDRFLREHGDETVEVAAQAAVALGEVAVAKAMSDDPAARARASRAKARLARRSAGLAVRGSRNDGGLQALQTLLGQLRALRWHYHTAHWRVRGDSFYGDHLLFERLYAGDGEDDSAPTMDDQIDTLAEKMVATYGRDSVLTQVIWPGSTAFIEAGLGSSECPFRQSIFLEEALQVSIRSTYDMLKAEGRLSLGMDDFLMSLASERETAIYLLRQRMS